MKLSPVSDYVAPDFPDMDNFSMKNLTEREFMPGRWLLKPVLCSAVAMLLLGNPCMAKDNVPAVKPVVSSVSVLARNVQVQKCVPTLKKGLTAPIFSFGAGSASTGGIAYIEPFFTSEATARKVIEDEFRKANVKFDLHDVPVKDLMIEGNKTNKNGAQQPLQTGEKRPLFPVVMSGYSSNSGIAYRYVSEKDFKKITGFRHEGTLIQWKIKDTADSFRNALDRYGRINAVVFYDPVSDDLGTCNSEPVQVKKPVDVKKRQIVNDRLRSQVRAYIRWARENRILK